MLQNLADKSQNQTGSLAQLYLLDILNSTAKLRLENNGDFLVKPGTWVIFRIIIILIFVEICVCFNLQSYFLFQMLAGHRVGTVPVPVDIRAEGVARQESLHPGEEQLR